VLVQPERDGRNASSVPLERLTGLPCLPAVVPRSRFPQAVIRRGAYPIGPARCPRPGLHFPDTWRPATGSSALHFPDTCPDLQPTSAPLPLSQVCTFRTLPASLDQLSARTGQRQRARKRASGPDFPSARRPGRDEPRTARRCRPDHRVASGRATLGPKLDGRRVVAGWRASVDPLAPGEPSEARQACSCGLASARPSGSFRSPDLARTIRPALHAAGERQPTRGGGLDPAAARATCPDGPLPRPCRAASALPCRPSLLSRPARLDPAMPASIRPCLPGLLGGLELAAAASPIISVHAESKGNLAVSAQWASRLVQTFRIKESRIWLLGFSLSRAVARQRGPSRAKSGAAVNAGN
jgi:hypothetical protein